MFYVYILWSAKAGLYYIGQTNDIGSRMKRHNSGWEKSTKPYRPWSLIFKIEVGSRSEALILERKLKNLSHERLRKFLKNSNPE